MMQAVNITTMRTAAITVNVTGSVVEICATIDFNAIPAGQAAARPSVNPSPSCHSPCLRINHESCVGCAPSAIRTPISAVRWVTEYAVTA